MWYSAPSSTGAISAPLRRDGFHDLDLELSHQSHLVAHHNCGYQHHSLASTHPARANFADLGTIQFSQSLIQ